MRSHLRSCPISRITRSASVGNRSLMDHLVRLTYPILWLAVFARQLCLPVPAILFLMMAGALSERGGLNAGAVLLVGVLGCLAGDLVWFEAGRRWGSRVMRLLCSLSVDPRYCVQRARTVFARWGLRSLFVAKFVPGLDGVTPPLAGMDGVSRKSFLSYDAVGAFFWSTFYAGIGYVFADRLEIATSYVNRFGDLLALGIGIPLVIYIGWRGMVLFRMVRELRLRKLSPSMLQEKLGANEKIAVIDLLSFEEGEESAGIPGAIRIDPKRIRSHTHVVIPEDLDVVLYCSSLRELTSARVAISLRKKGIPKVWILDGGLSAWKSLGYPVVPLPSTNAAAVERLGIRILDDRGLHIDVAKSHPSELSGRGPRPRKERHVRPIGNG